MSVISVMNSHIVVHLDDEWQLVYSADMNNYFKKLPVIWLCQSDAPLQKGYFSIPTT